MKFSLALTVLIGAVPYLAQGFALPDAKPATEVASLSNTVSFATVDLLSKRADDEWLMVIYNNGPKGNQCGGVANKFDGKGNLCQGLTGVVGKLCADVKLEVNAGFAKCDFSFRADGTHCGGKEREHVSVHKGKDSNGVKLSDDVRFVSISCSK